MSLSLYILSLGTSINVKHPRWPPLPRLVLPLPPGIHPEGNSLWHTQPPASAIAVLVAPKPGGKNAKHGYKRPPHSARRVWHWIWMFPFSNVSSHNLWYTLSARDDSTASYHHAWSLYTLMQHCTVPSKIVQRLRRVWDQHRPTYHWQKTNARTTTTVHSWGRENAEHLMLYPTSAL